MKKITQLMFVLAALASFSACQSKPTLPPDQAIARGLELYNAGKHREAIDTWKQVPSNDPLYAAAQNNMASSYILLREFTKAEESITTALKLQPNEQLFLNNRSWLEQEKAKK